MNISWVSRFGRFAVVAWLGLVFVVCSAQASGMDMNHSGSSLREVGASSTGPLASAFLQRGMPSDAAAGGLMALLGGSILFMVFIMVAVYVYFALAISTIAAKTNHDNRWMAWVPILNLILLLNIAGRPVWWILLFLIPLVNIAIMVIVWMGVAKARNKPDWWGVLMIVPLVNLVIPGVLAFTD